MKLKLLLALLWKYECIFEILSAVFFLISYLHTIFLRKFESATLAPRFSSLEEWALLVFWPSQSLRLAPVRVFQGCRACLYVTVLCASLPFMEEFNPRMWNVPLPNLKFLWEGLNWKCTDRGNLGQERLTERNRKIYMRPEEALSQGFEGNNAEDQAKWKVAPVLAVKTRLSPFPLLLTAALQASLLPDKCRPAHSWQYILFGTMQLGVARLYSAYTHYIQNITMTTTALAHSGTLQQPGLCRFAPLTTQQTHS